jgi:hypothetical protein
MTERAARTNANTKHRGQLSVRWMLVGMLALSFAPSGCHLRKGASEPTNVSQGELFETGSPIYDEYFATVHEIHATVATARLEERDARTSLATVLNLLPTATEDHLLRKLGDHAEELPPMRLVVDKDDKGPTARVTLLEERAKADDKAQSLILIIEATAGAELQIAERLREIPERSRRMHNLGKTLEQSAETDFADRARPERDRIDRELNAALDLLRHVADESREVEAGADAFVEGLQLALHRSLRANQGNE